MAHPASYHHAHDALRHQQLGYGPGADVHARAAWLMAIKLTCMPSNTLSTSVCIRSPGWPYQDAWPEPSRDIPFHHGWALVQLANAAVSLAREALQLVNLGEQTASHPRVGTVDHISCHPFSSEAPLAAADETAQLIGEQQFLASPLLFYARSCCWP